MTVEVLKKMNQKYPIWLADLVEDDDYYMKMIEGVLDLNGLHNRRKFEDNMQYELALKENPYITPQIALIDFSPGMAVTGLDITKMLVKRSEKKVLRTKVIMLTHHDLSRDIRKFFHIGGFAWVNKMESDAGEQMKWHTQEACEEIKEAYMYREFVDELKEGTQ